MATDRLLTTNDQKERLSMVYVLAIVARAGYTTAVDDLDRDGVDLRIQAGGAMRPALDLQLKATINLRQAGDESFRFPLPVRNYDLLRIRTQTPRLLVVLDLPRDEQQWLTITEDELIIRHRAYWCNLVGEEEKATRKSVTVPIPRKNLFDVAGLQDLMERSRTGVIL